MLMVVFVLIFCLYCEVIVREKNLLVLWLIVEFINIILLCELILNFLFLFIE